MPAVTEQGELRAYDFGIVSGSEGAGLDALDLGAIKDNDIVRVGLAVIAEFNERDAGERVHILCGNVARSEIAGALILRLDERILNRTVHRFKHGNRQIINHAALPCGLTN